MIAIILEGAKILIEITTLPWGLYIKNGTVFLYGPTWVQGMSGFSRELKDIIFGKSCFIDLSSLASRRYVKSTGKDTWKVPSLRKGQHIRIPGLTPTSR